jgi:hypothetical protein
MVFVGVFVLAVVHRMNDDAGLKRGVQTSLGVRLGFCLAA